MGEGNPTHHSVMSFMDIETVEHMIFNCPEAQNIWKRIGTIMNINIKWKHVLLVICISTEILF